MNKHVQQSDISPADQFRSLNYPLAVSAEIWEETQPQSVTGIFPAPGPRDEDMNTHEGGLVISADRYPETIENIYTEMPTTNVSREEIEPEPERATAESSCPHRFASASASETDLTPPIDLEAAHIDATTTVTDAPLVLHNAVNHLIAKHPKVLSTVSTVLTTVGGIILFPGVSACVRGTIFAHPAITIAGGIAFAVGRWLRRALNTAAALTAAQARE